MYIIIDGRLFSSDQCNTFFLSFLLLLLLLHTDGDTSSLTVYLYYVKGSKGRVGRLYNQEEEEEEESDG